MEHTRIDEGVKRGPRQRKIKPADLERETRQQLKSHENGRFLPAYSPTERQDAITEALNAIEYGSSTVEDIADRRSIPSSTLYSWLVGSEASSARTRFYAHLITRAAMEIRSAQNPLDLTRAREEVTAWIKVAERRDAAAWGQKQQVDHSVTLVHVEGELGLIASSLISRIRESVAHTPNAALLLPESVDPLPE